jgi:trafficking protein particle complex subunit 6
MAFDQHAVPPLALPPADPTGPHVASSCFDLLQIELVPLAYRLAAAAADREASAAAAAAAAATASSISTTAGGAKSRAAKTKSVDTGTGSVTTLTAVTGAGVGGSKNAGVVALGTAGADGDGHALGIGGVGGVVKGLDEEETRESVFWRLDALGYRVGLGIVDRYVLSNLFWVFNLLRPTINFLERDEC